MKKISLLFAVIIMLLSFTFSASAYRTYKEDGFTFTVSDDEATIIDADVSGDVVIPSALQGYEVQSISNNAFSGNRGITSVTISDGIYSIGEKAFFGCSELKSVIIPGSVTYIGKSSFDGCSSLESITLPFTGHSPIKGDKHFGYIFGAYDYTDNYEVPHSLKEVIITAPCEKIIAYAFYGCDSITSITLPDTITCIGNNAFEGCKSLTDIRIPDSVTAVEPHAFYKCTGLQSVTVGSSVTTIDNYAFSDCTSLKSITLPDSVKTIGFEAFYNTAYYNNVFNWTDKALYIDNHLIKVLDTVASYNIKQGTRTIASSAFYKSESLTSVIIPGSVTSISGSAFADCSALTGITIPEGVTYIGSRAFAGCSGLKSIIIPDSVTSPVGTNTFFGCRNLESVTLSKNTTYIGNEAFYDCHRLKSITIPDSVTSIGNTAFHGCTDLKSITIPRSVTSIGNTAFENCYSLESITIPGSVSSIGFDTFKCCTGLKSVTLEEGVASINHHAFSECEALTSIAIPASLKKIGEYAFDTTSLSYVFYGGTEEQRKEIAVELNGNDKFVFDAVWHFKAADHSFGEYKTIKNATCAAAGSKQRVCSVCKHTEALSIAKLPHSNKTATTKATLKKNGKVETKCSVCGTVSASTTVYYPKTIKLAASSYTYNGKAITPAVTVKNSKGTALRSGTDYTISYPKKRKDIGKYTVTINFIGNYSGTKKLTFEILPAKVKLSKVTAGSKQLTASWKAVSGVTGYEVMYSTSNKFTKKTTKTSVIKKAKTSKTTIKKLLKGKKYYVKVRAYKTVGNTKIYGKWSSTKSVKVK